MKPARTPRDLLEDIELAIRKALEFVAGLTLERFAQDDKSAYAVVRALEIVGEATKRLSPEFRDQAPGIPWRAMAGIRDKLIHDYVSVNLEVVWNTVTHDLPPLLPLIQQLIDQLREAEPSESGS